MTDSLLQHLTPDEVELWAQGLLPAARDAHLAQCAECRVSCASSRVSLRSRSAIVRHSAHGARGASRAAGRRPWAQSSTSSGVRCCSRESVIGASYVPAQAKVSCLSFAPVLEVAP